MGALTSTCLSPHSACIIPQKVHFGGHIGEQGKKEKKERKQQPVLDLSSKYFEVEKLKKKKHVCVHILPYISIISSPTSGVADQSVRAFVLVRGLIYPIICSHGGSLDAACVAHHLLVLLFGA